MWPSTCKLWCQVPGARFQHLAFHQNLASQICARMLHHRCWYFLGDRQCIKYHNYNSTLDLAWPIWSASFDPQPNLPRHYLSHLDNCDCNWRTIKNFDTRQSSFFFLQIYHTEHIVIPFRFNMAFRDALSLKAACNKVIFPWSDFKCFTN